MIPTDISLHAVGQGALGIECVSGQKEVLDILKTLEHKTTSKRCLAERSFLRELEGGCQVPIGVRTEVIKNDLILEGMVASLDGKRLIRDKKTGPVSTAEEIGIELANELKSRGAGEILEEIFKSARN